MLVSILWWIAFGALAGVIASALVKGEGSYGVLGTIVIGIIGAIIGGFISRLLGGPDVSGFNLMSILVAVAGSVVLLLILRSTHRGGTIASH